MTRLIYEGHNSISDIYNILIDKKLTPISVLRYQLQVVNIHDK